MKMPRCKLNLGLNDRAVNTMDTRLILVRQDFLDRFKQRPGHVITPLARWKQLSQLMIVRLPLTGTFDGRDKESQYDYDPSIRTGLIPPTEVPSPGSKEPFCVYS